MDSTDIIDLIMKVRQEVLDRGVGSVAKKFGLISTTRWKPVALRQ